MLTDERSIHYSVKINCQTSALPGSVMDRASSWRLVNSDFPPSPCSLWRISSPSILITCCSVACCLLVWYHNEGWEQDLAGCAEGDVRMGWYDSENRMAKSIQTPGHTWLTLELGIIISSWGSTCFWPRGVFVLWRGALLQDSRNKFTFRER